MDWRDQGVLLTVRRHGENAAIIDVMTEHHGRHAGVVRGGAGRRMAPVLQPGAQIIVEWRARLEDHLGAYRVEPLRSRAAALMGDGDALAAMGAVAALLSAFLAEREPHDALYRATCGLLDMVGSDSNWPEAYIAWELALLSELGFPLDLSCCAVTEEREDLAFVSPRTGRAVSSHAGAAYADRLLPLPRFLGGIGRGEDIVDGLRLTGHFLTEWVSPAFARADATPARQRLVDRLCRHEIGKSIGKVV